ncbi:hypothetical protein M3Y96_01233600 [Aphelenchoides besseyi]|nr:hypothetical protein M3Y96_01233600 [Aphelenchoides besseyi]
MKTEIWVLTTLFVFFAVSVHSTPPIHCLNDTLHQTAEPWPKLSLPLNYKVVVRFTDLIQSTTAKITETNYTSGLVITKEQLGIKKTFIKRRESLIRYQGDDCSVANLTDLNNIYGLSDDLRQLFNNSATNLGEILSGMIAAQYDGSHAIGTQWIDGVDTASWLGCVNQTDKRPAIEVDVQFLGDTQTSLKPYANVSRPLVASIRLSTFTTDPKTNKTTVLSHLWLNVVEVEESNAENENTDLQVPRGTFCNGMPAAQLPSELPLKFEADIEYVDVEKKVKDTIELMYDGDNKIVSFALDFDTDTDVPYVQSERTMQLGKARVYQDFTTGYEYILSKDGRVCGQIRAINSSWNDVETVDGKLNLRNPTDVLFNITKETAYYAGQIRESGALYDSFVTRKIFPNTKDYIVVELLFVADGWRVDQNQPQGIHSIVQYHKKSTHELNRTTITRFNSFVNNTLIGTSWSRHNVFTCLHELQAENFFYLKLEDQTMEKLQTYGFENVESALVEAISKTANISVLRISQFLIKQSKKDLYACFILAENNNSTKPAQTRYLRPEKSVDEVRKILNDTLLSHKIVVSVVTDESKTVTVSIQSMGVLKAEDGRPQPPPTYTGYSSGSLFITGIFMFIFGAGITVASYVFIKKREHVRGIAYQVFE